MKKLSKKIALVALITIVFCFIWRLFLPDEYTVYVPCFNEDVEKYDIDVFVMGNDWEGKFDFLKDQCEVVYLPRTPEISTTKIKEDLNDKPV